MPALAATFGETSQSKTQGALLEDSLRTSLAVDGKTPATATVADWYKAVTGTLCAALSDNWQETRERQRDSRAKDISYLSIEYLPGPNMQTALFASGLNDAMRKVLTGFGVDPEKVIRHEPDPGLGNGGLGRLAACFLDSGANLHLPMVGYGLFYEKGFFRQHIGEHGHQSEHEDLWVADGGHWMFPQQDRAYTVRFFGHEECDWYGKYLWKDAISVKGRACDVMIPGHDGLTTNTLRLWKSELPENFNTGNAEANALLGRINERLYPDDSHEFGKKLRLMQEYFFTSLSIQDIVHRHLTQNRTLDNLAKTSAIQLNDTHPAIAVAELMRILVDEHGVEWNKAKEITRATCFYTNHTLMPEALEHWHEGLMGHLLPRHRGIIQGLHEDLMKEVDAKIPPHERDACKDRVAIIRHGQIRMGHLAAFYSAKTNGVSVMHSGLVRENLFPDLERLRGTGTAANHTNGVTPRRWLLQANTGLAALIEEKLGHTDWVTNLSSLDKGLNAFQHNQDFRARFRQVKIENKERLAARIKEKGGPDLKPTALFDVQIKRFHEYKRQFMNILHTVALYQDILENPGVGRPDTVKIFAGKAAPTYAKAKEHIALVNWLAGRINGDSRVGDRLKVVFMGDYNVSNAQVIIPAADISEQISTAGTEASGTSNMKFALNGALTIGTRDGANVEIGYETGEDNIFFFGKTKEEIDELDRKGYNPQDFIKGNPRLQKALDFLRRETPFGHLADDVQHGDRWKIAADFGDYWDKQERARSYYLNNPESWLTKSIVNTRKGAHFSSDDTIRRYADMWGVSPVIPGAAAPAPVTVRQPSPVPQASY